MSVSIGVFTATAMFLAIGWDTEDTMGFEMYMHEGMGPCMYFEDARRHLRLLDAEPCVSKMFIPYPLMLHDEKLLSPREVPADQPNRQGHWMKLQL
jgi:hypothetical protein